MNNWKKTEKPCSEADIAYVEQQLGIRFPRSFREMMIDYHGAYAREKDVFDTADEKGKAFNNFVTFFSNDRYSYILRVMDNISDRLPGNAVPFARDPGGNYLCFRYSDSSNEPEVWYWDHELAFEDPTTSLTFVAHTFEAFLDSLYEWVDEE